ncbi:MAG TPA: TonB-dependent receptor plug domain-containing protein [Lacunisphaera sp.]|nr:TonB-dependent receptor plug domain-containing protein [Lacunisphaera sp.]
MKPTRSHSLRCATAGALLLGTAAYVSAQTAPAEKKEDVVTLPTFTITETPLNSYVSKQALSGTRVAMDIQDIPQTVSVVTSDFLKDTMSQRMLDAAKYITPVVESTLPVGGDRYTIRGFQVSHEFIDGMVISGEDGYSMAIAPYNIDRVEIIKGPNAILVPGGAPGGQFNPITKSPIMKDQASATLELAQYVGNAVSTDINRVISADKGIAGRLVAAYWDTDGFQREYFRKGWMLAPSLSWQLSPDHKLIAKAEFVHNDESTALSVPLDPRVGSDDYARIAQGLPDDWSFGSGQDHRVRETERITLELLSTLNDHITSRLMVSANHVLREDQGGSSASIFWPVNGVLTAFNPTRNPYTGKYEPGVTWSVDNSGATAVATSTATPIPDPSTWVFRRINGSDHLYYNEAHLRNDYAGKWETDAWKSTTIAGLAANFSKTKWRSWAGSSQGGDVPNTPAGLAAMTTTPYVFTTLTQARIAKLQEVQVYMQENANFFQDRLLLIGGISRYHGTLTRTDTTNIPAVGPERTLSISSTAKSYGLIVRPIKPLSLYYSHNTSGATMPGSLQAGNANLASTALPPYKPSEGEQDEYGVKVSLFDGNLTFSASHFEITQTNYAVPNSEYYVLVAQGNQAAANLLPTSTFLDVISKGWEFEGSWVINKNLTLIGNYSDYTYRQPTGVRIRAVPDRILAAFADYRFHEGPLANFGFNVGIDSKSDMVGESVTALTTSKPLTGTVGTFPGVAAGFVPQQASYKYDGRTLVNLGFSYRAKDWVARVQVNNLLDEDYISVGGSRTAIAVGNPREFRATFTYNY